MNIPNTTLSPSCGSSERQIGLSDEYTVLREVLGRDQLLSLAGTQPWLVLIDLGTLSSDWDSGPEICCVRDPVE